MQGKGVEVRGELGREVEWILYSHLNWVSEASTIKIFRKFRRRNVSLVGRT